MDKTRAGPLARRSDRPKRRTIALAQRASATSTDASTGTQLSLGYRGMVSRRKNVPYLIVGRRSRGDDANSPVASQPNHRLESKQNMF